MVSRNSNGYYENSINNQFFTLSKEFIGILDRNDRVQMVGSGWMELRFGFEFGFAASNGFSIHSEV
jgi:hypothetical protein